MLLERRCCSSPVITVSRKHVFLGEYCFRIVAAIVFILGFKDKINVNILERWPKTKIQFVIVPRARSNQLRIRAARAASSRYKSRAVLRSAVISEEWKKLNGQSDDKTTKEQKPFFAVIERSVKKKLTMAQR